MKRRPIIEHRRPDEADMLRARKAKAAMQNRVSAALAPVVEDAPDASALGAIIIEFGANIIKAAVDGSRAASALGAAAGRAEPLCPPAPRQALALATFGGKRA